MIDDERTLEEVYQELLIETEALEARALQFPDDKAIQACAKFSRDFCNFYSPGEIARGRETAER